MQIAKDDMTALRKFGWQMAIAWPLLFGLLLPWLFASAWPLWPWLLAAMLAVLAVMLPRLLYWPARLWLSFAHVMGWINNRLILAVLFFIIITPLGLVLRLLGKLDYKPRRGKAESYWQHSAEISADNMKDPF